MRKYLYICLLAVILTGCSSDEEPEAAVSDSADEKKTEEQTEKLGKKEELAPATPVAESLEELAATPPGELTKDFTLDQETSMFSRAKVPNEIKEEFLDKLTTTLQQTEDPEMIHEALNYYLGNAQYEFLVTRLLTYNPEFEEPLLPEPYEMNEDGSQETSPSNAIILLDASSSMLLQADGQLKMDTAKSAARSFAKAMGQNSNVSLYGYGHKGSQNKSDQELSCNGIEEVYPLGTYEQEVFNEAVKKVEAKGWTPLAGAIAKAADDHQNTSEDITLYIISDGEETCGGDPVQEAEKFAASDTDRHVNVIGFQVDSKAESQLQAVAKAGNGSYLGADSLEEMTEQMTKVWLPSDLDLVSLVYAKPIGWPTTMAITNITDYARKANDANNVEKLRLHGAVTLLQEEELIDEITAEKLGELIDNQNTHYSEMIQQTADEKKEFVESEKERITNKIDAYTERIKKLKEEQR